ncbi:SCO family protein [Prosthecobacter sp.]|uniref:SCO family protein n=1 Tax=Prosthecobacter sp. TaxID=1965333 RepID=UPI0037838ABE
MPNSRCLSILLTCLLILHPFTAHAQTLPPDYKDRVGFDQHPGHTLPLNAVFADESGRPIRLGSLLGTRPAVLVLAYYGCPNLCTVVLNSTLDSLRDLKRTVGTDFDVIVASFDPSEKPPLAAAKKAATARRYGRPGSEAGWHFLTGNTGSIRQLTSAVGYRYFYDQATQQFAHPSGIVVITPEGKIARYFMGVDFPPQDLATALDEAAAEKISPLSRALLLLCFVHDPATGRYTLLISRVFQIAGVLTVAGLIGMLAFMSRTRTAPPASSA